MFGKIVRSGLILCLCICGLVASANAQEPIPPGKRALIQELLAITNSQINYGEMIDQMLRQQEEEIPKHIGDMLEDRKDLSPQEREEMQKTLLEKSLRFSKRLRELLPRRIDLKHEVEEITYPLYNKYFTETDIRDMISFYKSPAGRKSIEILPQLMVDTMKRLQEVISPKMEALAKEIIDEEKKRDRQTDGDPVKTPE